MIQDIAPVLFGQVFRRQLASRHIGLQPLHAEIPGEDHRLFEGYLKRIRDHTDFHHTKQLLFYSLI